jgi:hypothetical protein
MDTSKEYIKMCEKAVEIQESWKRSVGDYAWRGKDYLLIPDAIGILTDPKTLIVPYNDDFIWLPRQDQLQEMVSNEVIRLMCDMSYFWADYDVNTKGKLSMEQLWLAFVMKENYKKQWNGEDWEVK